MCNAKSSKFQIETEMFVLNVYVCCHETSYIIKFKNKSTFNFMTNYKIMFHA